jgi:hypothetical protein
VTQPKIVKELLDIATPQASGEEAVRAIFVQGDGKMVPGSSRGAPPKATGKDAKRSAKGSKKGQKQCPNKSQSQTATMTMTTRK